MTTTIDKTEALRLLKLAVDEKGEGYVYPFGEDKMAGCEYVNPATLEPKCIVGVALAKAGVDMSLFLRVRHGAVVIGAWNTAAINLILGSTEGLIGDLVFTPAAQKVLKEAQLFQDVAHSWGEAYDCAARLSQRLADQ